mmetsp:Transcript_17686/g.21452  ORF Transcript_17686/g.21452 Transcript_17686/m.21452 type:complete len:397 (+) Transcript_17686:205-1395(+)
MEESLALEVARYLYASSLGKVDDLSSPCLVRTNQDIKLDLVPIETGVEQEQLILTSFYHFSNDVYTSAAFGEKRIRTVITEYAGPLALVRLSLTSSAFRSALSQSNLNLLEIKKRKFSIKELVYAFFPKPYANRYWNITGIRLDIMDELAEAIGIVGRNVENLCLSRCTGLEDLTSLATCRSLRVLDLSMCTGITDLSPLLLCYKLESLKLAKCTELTSIQQLKHCTSLAELNVSRCYDIGTLPQMPQLRILNASHCIGLYTLRGLLRCVSLTSLDLSGCEQLIDISALRNLTSLKSLSLSGMSELVSLQPLTNCHALEDLHLNWCHSLNDISPIAKCEKLHCLYFIESKAKLSITPLLRCKSLSVLYIPGSKEALRYSDKMTITYLQAKLEVFVF